MSPSSKYESKIFKENEPRFFPCTQETWYPVPPYKMWFDWRFCIELLVIDQEQGRKRDIDDPWLGNGFYNGPWKHEDIIGQGLSKISYTSKSRGRYLWIVDAGVEMIIEGQKCWFGKWPD